jgi:hypothetical protein
MIKNEKQYKISKKRLLEMNTILKEKKAKVGTSEAGALSSLALMRDRVAEQIKQYESLKTKGIPSKRSISVMQLPNILIQYKIAKGFTQKQYSEILGIKEQQLQRYEAENYASVSFGRLMDYVEKAKLKIRLAVEA